MDVALAAAATERLPSGSKGIAVQRGLVLGLFGLLATQQMLLWAFLGYAWWTYVVGTVGFGGLILLLRRADGWSRDRAPSAALFATCLAVAALACVLGGEGRFFYANIDWQVRDAVLRDLVVYPWPFVYQATPSPLMLRLPLGMYIIPALLGKALGYRVAELALLGQNSLLLATILSLGAALFRDTRARVIGLVVFLGFSGMDILGAALLGEPLMGHMEYWIGPQYSSHVTQIFWVPQHGMAGWIGALLYMLWRDDRLPRAVVLAIFPLLALMSPLALMGLVPFAAHAGLDGLFKRRLVASDIVLPSLALVLAVPSLLYLAAANDTVGERAQVIHLPIYLLFELLEVAPYLIAVRLFGRNRFGAPTAVIVAAVLLLVPFGQVGTSGDFVMRASIPALAILATLLGDILAETTSGRDARVAQFLGGVTFAIGLCTPASEIWRAVHFPASPPPLCSFLGVVPGGSATYVTPLSRVPSLVHPGRPAVIEPHDPKRCWAGPWPNVASKW
ncbi:hypothetical protein [uncultured Sphingomonas sp.]|uniref:hypothetical protein n=1 Tax=uncultured Sphingomonas sp. TaxID=158754 RepID=UPI00263264EA|nr:hypothetical protein [uncultured Sphingomonas sp.]